jgi:hypothetical protein
MWREKGRKTDCVGETERERVSESVCMYVRERE